MQGRVQIDQILYRTGKHTATQEAVYTVLFNVAWCNPDFLTVNLQIRNMPRLLPEVSHYLEYILFSFPSPDTRLLEGEGEVRTRQESGFVANNVSSRPHLLPAPHVSKYHHMVH